MITGLVSEVCSMANHLQHLWLNFDDQRKADAEK